MISREQIYRRLRDDGWKFKRRAKRVEIWKKPGDPQRLTVPLCDHYEESLARVVLSQAGLTADAINAFIAAAVK